MFHVCLAGQNIGALYTTQNQLMFSPALQISSKQAPCLWHENQFESVQIFHWLKIQIVHSNTALTSHIRIKQDLAK